MIAWLDRYHGRYAGSNTLYAPEDPNAPSVSEATLELAPYAHGHFQGLRYRWSHPAGETDQDGLLLLGERDGRPFGLWIDSYHNGRDVMRLEPAEGAEPAADAGTDPGADAGTDAGDRVTLRGTFAVPHGPAWGWTVSVQGGASEEGGPGLAIVMDVVPPGEEPVRAVEAAFARLP